MFTKAQAISKDKVCSLSGNKRTIAKNGAICDENGSVIGYGSFGVRTEDGAYIFKESITYVQCVLDNVQA